MKFINGEISRGEYETGVIVSDDGYYTDDYMSDSDDEEEENFRRMDMHGDPIYEEESLDDWGGVTKFRLYINGNFSVSYIYYISELKLLSIYWDYYQKFTMIHCF